MVSLRVLGGSPRRLHDFIPVAVKLPVFARLLLLSDHPDIGSRLTFQEKGVLVYANVGGTALESSLDDTKEKPLR
jgi:hypothetical protein